MIWALFRPLTRSVRTIQTHSTQLLRFRYQLPTNGSVKLVIYNMLGQKVRTLVKPGSGTGKPIRFTWDGLNDAGNQVSSGVYIYRFEANDFSQVKKNDAAEVSYTW